MSRCVTCWAAAAKAARFSSTGPPTSRATNLAKRLRTDWLRSERLHCLLGHRWRRVARDELEHAAELVVHTAAGVAERIKAVRDYTTLK
jgi:hypothetical protein